MAFPFFQQPPNLDPLTPELAKRANSIADLAAYRPGQAWSFWFSRMAFLMNTLAGYVGETPIVFELPGVRANASDTSETRQVVYIQRNAGNTVVGSPLTMHFFGISAKVAPAGSDYYPEVLYSRDNGTTWTSVFLNTLIRPFLPIGSMSVAYTNIPMAPLKNGDLLRIDETGCDGTTAGVELYLLGTSILGA